MSTECLAVAVPRQSQLAATRTGASERLLAANRSLGADMVTKRRAALKPSQKDRSHPSSHSNFDGRHWPPRCGT
jgi:hypothetical protein